MTGGLIQLISSGNEDLILTYKPDLTFFKKIYHRHTNFSKFSNKIIFKDKMKFGKKSNILIPKNGDLLDNIYIKVILPKLRCKYSRNKYAEYNKRFEDYSLKDIKLEDYKITTKNIKNLNNFFKLNSKFYNLIFTDDIYYDGVSISIDNEKRIINTNNWPTFDGWDSYTSVNTNIPSKRTFKLKLPINPEYAPSGQYSKFFGEFNASTFEAYGDSLDNVSAQMWTIGLVGRFTTPNTHWSSTNLPLEAVILDPLPAATGGNSDDPLDFITLNEADQFWDDKFISEINNKFVSDEVKGTFYKPGYFYRYFLGSVSNEITELQLDSYGGHVQSDGDWHMHVGAIFLTGYENCIIGYALDGTPILGVGSTVLDSSGNTIGIATSSWITRTDYSHPSAKNGSGHYHYDYIYSDGSGTLDEFNGGYINLSDGTTTILTYVYFMTTTYPIWPRNLRGKIDDDNYQEFINVVLQKNRYFLYSETKQKTLVYYIKSSELNEKGLNLIKQDDSIFSNFKYDDNIIYNINLLETNSLSENLVLYYIYANYLYNHNYHSYFVYFLYKIVSSSDEVILMSPYIFLKKLFDFYKNQLISSVNIESLILFEINNSFEKGIDILTTIDRTNLISNNIYSLSYIFKISKQELIEESNLEVIYLCQTDDIYSSIYNIYKKIKIKTTNTNDEEFNYNFYYNIIESKFIENLKIISNSPVKSGITLIQRNILEITENSLTGKINIILDQFSSELYVGQIIFCFLETNTELIYPDTYYKITYIDFDEIKLICEITNNVPIITTSLDTYNFFDGVNKINVCDIISINSDIMTNFRYVNNLDSNFLSSLSKIDYITFIRETNDNLLQNNFHFIYNFIDSLLKESVYISTFFNIDQQTSTVDGSSIKNQIDQDTLETFMDNFKKNLEGENYDDIDFTKYYLLNRFTLIIDDFVNNQSLNWYNFIRSSLDNNFNNLLDKVGQIEYLKNNKPTVGIIYSRINLSDSSTISSIGDIYLIYPNNGSDQADTTNGILGEVTVITKTSSISPTPHTILVCTINGEYDYNEILEGYILVKESDTSLYAKITTVFNTYNDVSTVTTTTTTTRGYLYVNIYYNFYLLNISNELLKTIPTVEVQFAGLYLKNYSDSSNTTTIPAIGDVYYLYDLYLEYTTASFIVTGYSYNGTQTNLNLKINSSSTINFKLIDSFWLINQEISAGSIGHTFTIVNKEKLSKINSVVTNILTRIYEICSLESYNVEFETITKEIAPTYSANYSQFFNSNSIVNVFIELIENNIDLEDIKLFLEGKTVSEITYNFTGNENFTKSELLEIMKSYLKIEYLETSLDFMIIKGMNFNTDTYFHFIDEFFKNPEEVGYEFYEYSNSSYIFNSEVIKNKIESVILKNTEVHSFDSDEITLYLDNVYNLRLSIEEKINNYNNNKSLLSISKFDIESNIFEDPDITRNKVEQYFSENNLVTENVDLTLYNSGFDVIFTEVNKQNTLFSIITEVEGEFKKYMLIENVLTALLKNLHLINDLTLNKNINKFIDATDIDNVNDYLIDANLNEYKHFTENLSNIYVPESEYNNILEKFNFIYSLSDSSKLIEKDIFSLDYFVLCQIIDYYNSENSSNIISSLEDYITTNLTNALLDDQTLDLKFKYGIIMTSDEFDEINYQNLTVYVDKVDEYGSLTSVYLIDNNIIVDNLVFPFDIKKIWFSNKRSLVKINLSESGNVINLLSNSVPSNFILSTNFESNKLNPQDIERNISVRVGTEPDNSDDDNEINKIWDNTVYDIGILFNGIVLGTTFYDDSIKQINSETLINAPDGYNWNLVKIYENINTDDFGGFTNLLKKYKIFSSKFLFNYKNLSINLPYYTSTNYEDDIFRHSDGHSKILGLSFDGYPIYGPYGYNGDNVIRMESSYRLVTTISSDRSELEYEIGSFIEDYEFIDGLGHLDKYNGRFSNTPEYPNGTYAYYMTIDESNSPQFPYIIGDFFKSTPSTSSTYVPEDDTSSLNTNVLPSSTTSTEGFNNNEELFLGGGSGINGEASIFHNENTVKLEIISPGFKYKKGDFLKLRRKSLPEAIEFSDEKKILLKRKCRFENIYYYDFSDNKLKITPIYENDVINLRSFSKEVQNMIIYDEIDINFIKEIIDSKFLQILPTNKIIEQLMTLDQNISNFTKEIIKVDLTGKIFDITKKSFFRDIFNMYLQKYLNGNLIYYYDEFTYYLKYSKMEYDLLKLNINDLLINTNINNDEYLYSQISSKLENMILNLDKNKLNLEDNKIILQNILNRPETPQYSWVGDIGNYIFKNINLYFNDLLIDKQKSEWVNLWKSLNINSNKIKGYNKLIGNLNDIYILSGNEKPSKTLYIPMNFWFCNKSGFNLPIVAMPYVNIKLSVETEDINMLVRKDYGVEIEGSMDFNSSLLVNYIYLDDTERKLFAESRHEYLIEQVQYNESINLYKNLSNINIELSFKNNIKDIIYVLKKNKHIYLRDRNNFGNLDNIINGGNPVLNTSLEFNGRLRFKDYSGEYTNYIIPYEKYSSTPNDGINVISFSLENNELQPTGSCNFSMIEKPYLKVNYHPSFLSDLDGEIHVYARSYNILRIMSGLAGLAFIE